jgi:hypothetical protein
MTLFSDPFCDTESTFMSLPVVFGSCVAISAAASFRVNTPWAVIPGTITQGPSATYYNDNACQLPSNDTFDFRCGSECRMVVRSGSPMWAKTECAVRPGKLRCQIFISLPLSQVLNFHSRFFFPAFATRFSFLFFCCILSGQLLHDSDTLFEWRIPIPKPNGQLRISGMSKQSECYSHRHERSAQSPNKNSL